MTTQTKLHDATIGVLVLASTGLAWFVDPRWIGLAGLTALVMISSAFTGFCPIHYTIGKLVAPAPAPGAPTGP
jgi:hypothetical protein